MTNSEIYNYLISSGLTKCGAAGLMGNLYAESGLRFNKLENLCRKRLIEYEGVEWTDALYTEAVDNGYIDKEEFLHPIPGKQYGYGLCQWTSPGRKEKLWNRCKSAGKSIADPGMQLDFMLWELRNEYKKVYDVLIKTDSIKEASDIVLIQFESPSDKSDAVKALRESYGKKYYDEFNEVYMVRISNSGHDENGKYSGGKAGDQTGGEWAVINWYNRPWNVVLRHNSPSIRNLLCDLSIQAAENDYIGYDQGQRMTYWEQLKKAGYWPRSIKTACEADCSAGVLANVKAAGILLCDEDLSNIDCSGYTGNMKGILTNAGFMALTDKKYLESPDYLLPGDILLYEGHHTAVVIDKGAKAEVTYISIPIGTDKKGLVTTEYLNIRKTPGGAVIKSVPGGKSLYPTARTMVNGQPWMQCEDGWFSGKFVTGWIKEDGKWWYVNTGYEYPVKSIVTIDGLDYAFDRDGWMITGDRITENGNIA